MQRGLALVGVGVLAGAAFTYWLDRHPSVSRTGVDHEIAAATADLAADLRQQPAERRLALAESAGVAGRAGLYRLALASSLDDLRSLSAEAAALPPSAGRTIALEAMLMRAVEIDPAAGIALAEELAVADEMIGDLYGSWAVEDPAAALESLSRVANSQRARSIAVALHLALGANAQAAGRVARSLRPAERDQFALAALEARAARTPERALQEALDLAVPGLRAEAAARVAAVWADIDPQAALAAAQNLEDGPLRSFVAQTVLGVWAQADAEALLDHMVTQGSTLPAETLLALASQQALDPARLLTLAAHLPPQSRANVEPIVLQGFIQRDPAAAWEHVRQMPAGAEREQALRSIALSYGSADLDAALDWASGLQPPQPELAALVLVGLARNDPERAVDAALAIDTPATRQQTLQQIANSAGMRGEHARATADKLLALADQRESQTLVATLVSGWAMSDARAALEWLLGNSRQAGAAGFGSIAQRFARAAPDEAAQYVDLVPSGARPEWIAHVALGYSQTDAQAALDWVARFRGEPAYPRAAAAVAQSIARFDHEAAARLVGTLDSASPDLATAMPTVVAHWARQEPAAAGSWVLEQPATEARIAALNAVAQTWGYFDAPAARRWTLALPPGASRDAALTGLVTASAAAQPLDTTLLQAFSNAAASEAAILRSVQAIAQRDPAEAERAVNTYVRDPQRRAAAEQMIMNAQRVPQNVVFETNGIASQQMIGIGSPVGLRSAPVALGTRRN